MPVSHQRPILLILLGVAVGAIGAGVWFWSSSERGPGTTSAAQTEGNWLTRLWQSTTAPTAPAAREHKLPPLPKGPVAPGLFLRAAFPSPDDPSQAYASISQDSVDTEPQLYRMGEVVVDQYTLAEVEQRYVGLDRDGKRFYLYAAPRQERQLSPEREARRKQREEMRAQRRLVREQRLAAKREATARRGPIQLPDGTIYVPVLGDRDRIEDGKGNFIRYADEPETSAGPATPR